MMDGNVLIVTSPGQGGTNQLLLHTRLQFSQLRYVTRMFVQVGCAVLRWFLALEVCHTCLNFGESENVHTVLYRG